MGSWYWLRWTTRIWILAQSISLCAGIICGDGSYQERYGIIHVAFLGSTSRNVIYCGDGSNFTEYDLNVRYWVQLHGIWFKCALLGPTSWNMIYMWHYWVLLHGIWFICGTTGSYFMECDLLWRCSCQMRFRSFWGDESIKVQFYTLKQIPF